VTRHPERPADPEQAQLRDTDASERRRIRNKYRARNEAAMCLQISAVTDAHICADEAD
jgi:hypothetical protein